MKTISRIPDVPNSSYFAMNRWFYKMYLGGLLFHVDDRAETIINTATNKPAFTTEECVKLNEAIDVMFEHHGDAVYECGIKYFYVATGIKPDCTAE
ncbi:MAG: hypothetical protein V4614_11745 [Pseudomonadota bacterium]